MTTGDSKIASHKKKMEEMTMSKALKLKKWRLINGTKIYAYCTCGREVNKEHDDKVCPLCGQKLDWGNDSDPVGIL